MPTTNFTNPPLYSAIALTTFFAVVFGVIFKAMLEFRVADWQRNRETQSRIDYQRPGLVVSYLLMCLSLVGFLTSSLAVFGFTLWFGAVTAGVMVVATGGLIWWQLGSLMELLAIGGSQALDIDSYGAGEIFDSERVDQG